LKTTPRQQYQILRAIYAETELAIAPEPISDAHRCSLLELSEARCRWPISSPGAEDFCFCGNLPVEGLPYCAGHSRLAYRPRVARGETSRAASRLL
jgi:GcrA cell cycle regulator